MNALFLNCTLKYAPDTSNTRSLIDKGTKLFKQQNISTEIVRVNDYNIKWGVTSDEGSDDEWPQLLQKIKKAHILVMGTPIWLGSRSSIAKMVIERLDGTYAQANEETGQFPLYNKVAGVIVTGNEDGAQNAAAATLFNLNHLGCTIPPNADCYWVGKAGPGPSYIEAGGERHLYTNKTLRYMVYNLTYMATLLNDHPIPTNLNALVEDAKQVSDSN